MSTLQELIREKRVSHPKNYSQSELSQLLGYKNGQFISNVERALCNIPLKMLPKVTEILDVSAEELKSAMLADHRQTLDNYLRGPAVSPLRVIQGGGENTSEEREEETATGTSGQIDTPRPIAAKSFY